jgi:uncharacterized protein YggT (Ycf19 family)
MPRIIIKWFVKRRVIPISNPCAILQYYIILIELRILLQHFCCNPHRQPLKFLWKLTGPVINFGRVYYPKIIGFDICCIVNTSILSKIITLCAKEADAKNTVY